MKGYPRQRGVEIPQNNAMDSKISCCLHVICLTFELFIWLGPRGLKEQSYVGGSEIKSRFCLLSETVHALVEAIGTLWYCSYM